MTKLLTFLLGFYVSTMMRRWWEQIRHLPSVENCALTLNSIIGPQGIHLRPYLFYCIVLNTVPSRIVSRLEYSPHQKLEILIESSLK